MAQNRISFEDLDRYISSLAEIEDPDQILDILQNQIKTLGFESVTYWLRWHKLETHKPIGFSTYPAHYIDHYIANDYQKHDMVGRLSNEKNIPFKWSDIAQEQPITKMQKVLFADSAAVGLRSGGSIPIHGPSGTKATFSVASNIPQNEFDELFTYHRHELHLLATYAHERIVALGMGEGEKLRLTLRETEILTWACRGKSYWDISAILMLQEDTVKKHMQNILMRLRASNGPHAISKGLVHGLILP